MFPAIVAAAVQLVGLIPKLIELGQDVAPLIVTARKAVDEIRNGGLLSSAEIEEVDSTVARYEADFADAVAAHRAAVAAG